MSLAKKLQIRPGQGIRLVNPPKGFKVDASVSGEGEAILLFAPDSRFLKAHGSDVVDSARRDLLAWVAYPKAGKLDTDLNRDKLSALMEPLPAPPVRVLEMAKLLAAPDVV